MDEILKLAASVGLYPYYPEQAGDIECFYKAAYNAGVEAGAKAALRSDQHEAVKLIVRALEKR